MMIEQISSRNRARLDDIIVPLAESYIDAFARPPWNERSKCVTCGIFSEAVAGARCVTCGKEQIPAYSPPELQQEWARVIDSDGMIEVALDESRQPIRTTIAGPISPDELFIRKYADVPAMKPWLAQTFTEKEVAYIYDTFCDLRRSPAGNLRDRQQTLGRIASTYPGMPIVTRTLQEAIVRATVRDAGETTDVYIGTRGKGRAQAMGARAIGSVPDSRTLLRVELQP